MILFGAKRKRAPLNQELEKIPEENLKNAIAKLSFVERKVALWYFGFADKKLTKPEITKELEISHDYLSTIQARICTKIRADVLNIKPPKNVKRHGKNTRYHENKFDKLATKKALLRCKNTEVWAKITKKQQTALSLFYCLDEDGDKTIFGCEVAKQMGVNNTRACVLIRRGKERLAKYYSALQQFLPPKNREKTKTKTRKNVLKIKIPNGRYKGLRIEEFLEKIASTVGITRDELVQKLHGKENEDLALARHLTISILAKTGLPRTKIAEVFGCASPSAVNHAVKRAKKILP